VKSLFAARSVGIVMNRLFGMREETLLLVFFMLSIVVPIVGPLGWLSFLSIPLFVPEVSHDFQLLVLCLACPSTPLLLFLGVLSAFCFRTVINFYADFWKTVRAMRNASGVRLEACRFLVRLFLRNFSRPAHDRLSLNEMERAVQDCGPGSGDLRVKRTAGGGIDYDAYEYRARDFLIAVCPELVRSGTSKAAGYRAEPDDPFREQLEHERRTQEQAQLANFMGDITSRLKEQERRHKRARRKK
jgi:hypothetical protein